MNRIIFTQFFTLGETGRIWMKLKMVKKVKLKNLAVDVKVKSTVEVSNLLTVHKSVQNSQVLVENPLKYSLLISRSNEN